MKLFNTVLLTLILSLFAAGQTQPTTLKTFTAPDGTFSIDVPNGTMERGADKKNLTTLHKEVYSLTVFTTKANDGIYGVSVARFTKTVTADDLADVSAKFLTTSGVTRENIMDIKTDEKDGDPNSGTQLLVLAYTKKDGDLTGVVYYAIRVKDAIYQVAFIAPAQGNVDPEQISKVIASLKPLK